FNWSAPGGNGATIDYAEYRTNSGSGWGSWQRGDPSDNTTVSGDWEQNHQIQVRVTNNHGQTSDSVSESRQAEADPTPPVTLGTDRGPTTTCDTGGTCRYIVLTYEDLPSVSGGYDVTFETQGSTNCSNTFTRSYSGVSISGSGDHQFDSYYGTSCDGDVEWTLTGGGETYTGSGSW
ncbi:MAG TPA: hypothetical protein VK095_03305, partial [Beutenbergiaceae bacterium]|nr:hypothetical protein [Beutenbergiaceae bacterium]